MTAHCIRYDSLEIRPCQGHDCVACGKTFYCGEPHRDCPPRPQRVETGITRRQSLAERLADGWKMLNDDGN